MSKKMIYLISFVFVLTLASPTYGIVIGNFENVMNGWEVMDANNVFLTDYNSTTGVTLDSRSLVIDVNGGTEANGYQLALRYSLIDNNMVDTFRNNLKVSMDITRRASEWIASATGRWCGLYVVVQAGSSAEPNWGLWDQLDTEATWAPGDGNGPKSYTYDYSTTINEIDFNNLEYLNFILCTNWGGYNPGGTYYFDNIRIFGGGPAYDPKPANNAREVLFDTDLSWTPGVYADKHDIYFGTNFNDVNSATRAIPKGVLVKQNYAFSTYNPGELKYGKTYFWRIDEVNGANFWPGEVWNFTTAYPGSGVVIGDWEDSMDGWLNDSPANVTITYSTTGATLNDKSLRLAVKANFWWVLKLVLTPDQLEDLKANDTLSLDVTWVTSEWTGGNWSKIEKIAFNSAATGWKEVSTTTDTSNPAAPGEWNPTGFGDKDTRTLTWDYSGVGVGAIPAGGWCHLQLCTNHDPAFGIRPYYFDNCRFMDSRLASNPNPQDRATDVQTDPTLSWKPGKGAVNHDVYFGTDYDVVKDANRTSDPYDVLVKQDHDTNSIDITDEVGDLEFETGYYWRIDEVNGLNIRKGGVWKFTTGHYLVVDDFESYNPDLDDTWKTGGKAEVSLSTDPVHGGVQAMDIDYDNNTPSPYYSEAYADTTGTDSLDFGTDWTINGVEGLSLWFRGNPDVRGSFTGTDPGPYTINAAGWDIEDTADGFHYAYKALAAPNLSWQITAKVDSIEYTGPWAKAGVMVRKTLEPNSVNVAVVITPSNGIDFQYRETAGGDTTDAVTTGFTPPEWLRLTRVTGPPATIHVEHANTVGTPGPSDWKEIGTLDDSYARYTAPLYMGLCVSSFDTQELCTAQFSNVSMLRNFPPGTPIAGSWADRDIGIPYNDLEPMYVVLEDSDSNGIVYHPNPNVVQISTWTHWGIELDEFSEDVDLTDVQRMYIGFGNRGLPAKGGSGTVFFDDIRLYAPGCVLSNRSANFAKADYAPESNPSGDCVVDFKEIEIMGRDWLKTPPPNSAVDLYVDDKIDFRDFAVLAEFWLEEQISLWP